MSGRLALLAQVASLVGTGWLLWVTRFGAGPMGDSPLQALWRSLVYAAAAWAWSAVIGLALFFVIGRVEREEVVRATLRTSSAAVWFAPATILLTNFSPLALPAAMVLVVNATRLLYAQWRVIHEGEAAPRVLMPQPAGLLAAGELPLLFLPRHFGPALFVSIALQFGLVADLWHRSLLAGAFFSLSTAVLTVFAIAAGAWEQSAAPSLPRNILAVFLTIFLASGLTLAGVAGGSSWGFGWGSGAGSGGSAASGEPIRVHNPATAKAAAERRNLTLPVEKTGGNSDLGRPPIPVVTTPDLSGSFPGVILWPEVKPVTTLIQPLPAGGRSLVGTARPFYIPFGGEYWMFRVPFSRPPRNSFFQRGSPADLSFSTTDRWPLTMEAHQKLPQPLDLTCCREIQLEIRNADRYPGTVSLELIAINDEFGGTARQSLGTAMVRSVPDVLSDPVKPVAETLDFVVPNDPAIHTCNEFKVVYLRASGRSSKSARVSLERFILIPR